MAQVPRLRFAPSPTGFLHIGGVRTALFNWLYARRNNGVFVLRIEDTDRERSTPESLQTILDGLKWVGIDWDEGPEKGGDHGPYFQTQRTARYKEVAEQLIRDGKAYRCYCTREDIDARRKEFERVHKNAGYRYERTCRDRTDQPDLPFAVRFKMPVTPGVVSFDDRVLGRIGKEYSDLDDWVMVRTDGIPTYNYGCVLDDHDMAITLVGRGQEHVNSTLPQLMLYKALGWEPPEFAHFPLILGQDREKLSKRKHPEADVMNHKKNGILPEALLNFVVRLGWSHGDDEIIRLPQMREWFDFAQVSTTSGVWNPDKLQWVNQQYFKMLPATEVAHEFRPFVEALGFTGIDEPRLVRVVEVLRERARTLVEMAETARYFFSSGVTLDEKAAAKHLTADSKAALALVRERLAQAADWKAVPLEDVVKSVAETVKIGLGKVAQPVRVAVTGGTASPGIGDTLELIGKDETLRRLDAALARIG